MKNMNKNPIRIIFGIVAAIILVTAGIKELKSSVSELGTSVEKLQEDIQDPKDGK